jgi:hypothetical protein
MVVTVATCTKVPPLLPDALPLILHADRSPILTIAVRSQLASTRTATVIGRWLRG